MYQITTPSACGGLIVTDGVVVNGAPYFRFLVGRLLTDLHREAKQKSWKLELSHVDKIV